MTDNMNKFLETLSSDCSLKSELENVMTDVSDEEKLSCIAAFAKEKGFELSKEDFQVDDEELNLDELETVAGAGGCGCAVFGGGLGDGLNCGCAFVGTGRVRINDVPISRSQGACYCGGPGAGATRRH